MNFSRRKRVAACLPLIDLLEECVEDESYDERLVIRFFFSSVSSNSCELTLSSEDIFMLSWSSLVSLS